MDAADENAQVALFRSLTRRVKEEVLASGRSSLAEASGHKERLSSLTVPPAIPNPRLPRSFVRRMVMLRDPRRNGDGDGEGDVDGDGDGAGSSVFEGAATASAAGARTACDVSGLRKLAGSQPVAVTSSSGPRSSPCHQPMSLRAVI